MWTTVATVWSVAKANIHGAATTQAPSAKFAFGSQSASATSAARLIASMAYPPTHRFHVAAGLSAKTQGEPNRAAAQASFKASRTNGRARVASRKW
jgi:hypothetical protein